MGSNKRHRKDNDKHDQSGAPSPQLGSDKRRRLLGSASPRDRTPRRTIGPSLPPQFNSIRSSPEDGLDPVLPQTSKAARISGPEPAPAPVNEKLPIYTNDDGESDSSADEFSPALPPINRVNSGPETGGPLIDVSVFDSSGPSNESPKKAQRDEWMTRPPSHDDLARVDPSKQRPRKFNATKSKDSDGGLSSAWTETPGEKLKRLQNEALGIATHSNVAIANTESRRLKEAELRVGLMKEKIDEARGKSLSEQHREKGEGKETEDDPSKRAFDYKKDMALNNNMNSQARREILSKSQGFRSRFSNGNFL